MGKLKSLAQFEEELSADLEDIKDWTYKKEQANYNNCFPENMNKHTQMAQNMEFMLLYEREENF